MLLGVAHVFPSGITTKTFVKSAVLASGEGSGSRSHQATVGRVIFIQTINPLLQPLAF